MYIYNVTINIDNDAHDAWREWMIGNHIPDVLATGQFLDARFTQVLVEEESGVTYSIQYRFDTMADYQLYQELFAPELQQSTEALFGGKFVAFRTLLEIVHEVTPGEQR